MVESRAGHRWKELDPAVPARTRELTEAIRTASDRAGRPSFRKLAARSAESGAIILSLSTLSRIFAPKPAAADQASLPSWPYYAAVLTLLNADPAPYRAQHAAAQHEWRTRTDSPDPSPPAPNPDQPVPTPSTDHQSTSQHTESDEHSAPGVQPAHEDPLADEHSAADHADTDNHAAADQAERRQAPEDQPVDQPATDDQPVADLTLEPPASTQSKSRVARALRASRHRPVAVAGAVAGIVLVVVVGVLAAVQQPSGSTAADARSKVARTNWPNHPDPRMDQTNPEVTGCAAMPGEETFYSHLYADWPHDTVQTAAVITLHYSPHCRTVWAVVTDAVPGAVARVHRTSDNVEAHCVAGPDGSCGTPQISDINVVTHADAQSGPTYGRTRDF